MDEAAMELADEEIAAGHRRVKTSLINHLGEDEAE
jgi:hypothetical protein